MAIARIDEAAQRVQIAARLKERRVELRLTQEEVARRAEVSKSFMSELETGITTGNGLIYVRLAIVLECTVQYLLTGQEPPESLTVLAARAVGLLEDIRDELKRRQ